MTIRTPREERRLGIRDLVLSGVLLVLMLAGWWLVESTNREGQHDAQLLPLFALIPLGFAVYHLYRSRAHR